MLQIANAELLKEYADNEENIYFVFKTAKIEDQSKLQKPFEQLDPEEVIVMIYKWLSENTRSVSKIQLRVHNFNHGIMHYIGLGMYNRQIYVLYVHDLPSNHQQITHMWKPFTTFNNLTINEKKESEKRAQEINYLIASEQMQRELPTIDAVVDMLLNEDKDPELRQSPDSNLAEEIAEPSCYGIKEL